MGEPFDSIATVRKEWPSLSWPVRALYASVPVLIAIGVTGVIVAGWKAFFPSEEAPAVSEASVRRVPSALMREELMASLRGFQPESFTISRTLSDADSLDLANAIRGDLAAAHWKNESDIVVVADNAVAPGLTLRMKKKSPPGSVYLLNWLNRAGLEARGLADVPLERTYDLAIEIGPRPGRDAGP
jgi:hypothetical protein